MALFKSLFNWAIGNEPPGYLQPNLKSSEEYAKQAIETGDTLLGDVQSLEGRRNEFLTGEISKRLNIFAPWLNTFSANLGETSTALAKGELPPEIAKSYERAGRSAAFGSGFGYAPKAQSLAALFGAEGALRGITTGVNTAESWLSLMNNIYAPATVNYAEKYLPSTAQTTQYETQRELIKTQAKNMARQFKYRTDTLTGEGGVYDELGNTIDTIGAALSVYLGGLGGIGGAAGGLMGMASGGGSSSATQFLSGIYSPGYEKLALDQSGSGAVGSTQYGGSWFGGQRSQNTNWFGF